MQIVPTLLNKSEGVVFRELQTIADDNALRVFAKTRLSDVIEKGTSRLTQREFDYYTRAHCDFVVVDAALHPVMVVEYDGPTHSDEVQVERDKIKDSLCRSADLGLLRINANHVTRQFRGMSILRWIVEVTEFEKQFYQAQEQGQIPYDEPCDPAMLAYDGRGRRWPYWLSVNDTAAIHRYFKSLPSGTPTGWFSIIGHDQRENGHRLSYIRVDNRVVWTKTAVRKQGLNFPAYDLLHEIATCELALKLAQFRRDKKASSSIEEFKSVFVAFIRKYDADPSSSMGEHPFDYSWSSSTGWMVPP
jgi:very-short-patch-repair endonuclease